jgi:hypothetical protein
MKSNADNCDPPCDENEECIDGDCTWSNIGENRNVEKNDDICNPPCSLGTWCVNRQCEPNFMPYCPVSCRPGQVCIDGRCGCSKGLLITNY